MKKTTKNLQTYLASASPKDVAKALRKAGAELKTCVGTVMADLEPDLKEKWGESIKSMEAALASIPEPDEAAASGNDEAVKTWAAISNTSQVVLAHFKDLATDATKKLEVTLASIPEQIKTAIEAKVKAGDLVPKDAHTQAVSDASAAAAKTARDAAMEDVKRITAHRLAITTASLPVPSDEILSKEDKEFDAAKALAGKRIDELKAFGLKPERVATLAWNADATAYANAVELMKEAASSATNPRAVNPYINHPGGDKKAVSVRASATLC